MCETGKYGFFFSLECKKKNILRMDSKYTVTSSTALSSGSKYIELREHDVILKKLTSLSADFCKKRIFNVLFSVSKYWLSNSVGSLLQQPLHQGGKQNEWSN